ncbi:SDR family oxidoreductase [Salsipaludibacter albus]|uniref:SDR family oxidoreductase n=1 Tax=Salsipaludibacter albus TaxID=2849650 RepID=UPI001EE4C1A9|nr:SDR family oxidoreductase [Salsipaludibacter albus]MBY5164319.1 SDR family oxidoreductase [Salsipaludibacter albus]
MRIVIAGGHGTIARLLSARLTELDADTEVVGLIRKPEQADDIREVGAIPEVLDLEMASLDELTDAVQDADAVVFAAGAGPGSGAGRKETVDFAAAVNLRDAARQAGVARYVMVSAMGTDDPPTDDVFSVYLRAKARADKALMESDLAWTIVRPGGLTDDEPTGTVTLARHVDRGEISRADVADVLAAVLHRPATAGHVFELVGGDTPVADAIDDLVAG